MKKEITIGALIKLEPTQDKDRNNNFLEDIKKRYKPQEKNSLKKGLFLIAALGIFAYSLYTNLCSPVTNQNSSYIEKDSSASKKVNKSDSTFEFICTPLVPVQINHSTENAYIQILKTFPKLSLDSPLCDHMQIFVWKPDFEIIHNKISYRGEDNKMLYSEWYHVTGEINGDKVTIKDMDGDGIPETLSHDKKKLEEKISLPNGQLQRIFYLSKESINRETIILGSNVDKNKIPYDKKDSSEKDKDLIKKAYKLFFDCLEYYNKEIYERKNGIERIILKE